MSDASVARLTAALQGGYYLITGLWPIVHRRSFEAITGPKTDFWLVRTIGALLALTGGILASSARQAPVPAEAALLSAGTAATLAGSDLIYSAKGRIRRIYALEALPEIGLVTLWVWAALRGRRS